jgi:hypothetical protein
MLNSQANGKHRHESDDRSVDPTLGSFGLHD